MQAIPLLPTSQFPKTILLAQIALAITLAVSSNSNAGSKVASIALSIAAIYVAYHEQVYALPLLLLIAAFVAIPRVSEGYSQILVPQTDIYLGCEDVKLQELLALFDNDEAKLRKAMGDIGVPMNVKMNDENAPLIATYLIFHKKKVSDTCKLPVPSKARADEIERPSK